MSDEAPSRWVSEIDQGVIIGLYGPVFGFLLWIKVQCVMALQASHTLLETAETLRSSVFVYAGLVLAYLALLVWMPRGRGAIAIRVGMLTLLSLDAFLEFTMFRLFVVTGTVMDWPLTLYFVANVAETFQVIRAESNPFLWVTIGLLAFGGLGAGAAALIRRLPPSGLVLQPAADRARRAGLTGAVAIACFLVAALPPANGPIPRGLGRQVGVQLAYGALSSRYALPDGESAEPWTAPVVTPRDAEHPNIVLFMLESTRARSVTPYAPDVPTTPYLDELSEQSLLVEQAFTTYTHTTKALLSMNCGIHPLPRMAVRETMQTDTIPVPCLADLLAGQGYRTASFSSATGQFEGLTVLMDDAGYQDILFAEDLDPTGFERANYFGWEDAILLEPTRKWLGEQEGPFFLQVVTGTPHHDYIAPAQRYGRVHYSDDEQTNLYLNSIAYLDHFAKEFLALFRDAGVYDDTLFVFVGDHGEGMGEHWARFHNDCLYEECLTVPLMFHQDGRLVGRIAQPADHLDLVPTVLDLAGFDLAPGALEGRSLIRSPEPRTHFASCWYDFKCVSSVRDDRKYIHFFDDIPDQVYDLGVDPLESRDLLGTDPESDAERREELIDWFQGTWARWEAVLPEQ